MCKHQALLDRSPSRSARRALASVTLAALVLANAPAGAGNWDHAHGDADNTGFNDVVTLPATVASGRVGGLGPYAPGAGPIIGPDGTIYLGSFDGWLRALTPTGALKWKRDTPGHKIYASPVVGADGSIYVVGTRVARDHRGGRDTVIFESVLYRFNATGAMLWASPFPLGYGAFPGTGRTSASPNIWHYGADEIIVVPAVYNLGELRLIAFSRTGGLLFNQLVSTMPPPTVTGSGDWGICTFYPCFNDIFGVNDTVLAPAPNQLDPNIRPPMPSVAISRAGPGGMPIVIVADNYEYMVGYTLSPAQGFQEVFRKHLTHGQINMTSPAILRDGHAAIGAGSPEHAWVLFGAPDNVPNWTELGISDTGATPTVVAGGRVLVVTRGGSLTVIGTIPGRSALAHVALGAESIAPAAASHSHIFVSAADRLITVDAQSLEVIANYLWTSGGLSPPAIGDCGEVYALAGDTLFMFAAPARRGPIVASLCGSGRVFDPTTGGVVR
jgi:outer membrane protein assembly factor BamB